MRLRPSIHTIFACSLLGSSLLGCGQGEAERSNWPGGEPPTQSEPLPNLTPTATETLDLSPWFSDASGSDLAGVAVAPNGDRYVLDKSSGLHLLRPEGTEPVLDSRNVEARYGLSPDLEFTDVVAYGEDRFLITAENDGFLLDLWAGSMRSHFCYFPPVRGDSGDVVVDSAPLLSISQILASSGIPVKQRTESVAVNVSSGQIFVQPQTLRLDLPSPDRGVAGSELFVFAPGGGQPLQVTELRDPAFSAGGMVAVNDRLLVGFQDGLYELSFGSAEAVRILALDAGVVVTGMALDGDQLLVLDGPARRLIIVDI